ncbi:MAG: glycine betaine ABC transporter substrate-binding protein, partial [Umezawaea sp.]
MALSGKTGIRGAGVALAVALTLAGCGGAKVGDTGSAQSGSTGDCGTFNIAINPWVGYEANAAVLAYVAEKNLGCKVTKKDLKEEVAWQGFGTGEVDAVVENWGHDDLRAKYIDDQKTAVSAGSTGVTGQIGWYVPPWMAEKYPDITDWNSLNKYADLFKTSESGDKGQLLDGDPSFVTNDEALVKNLNLNYKVVYGGSETALALLTSPPGPTGEGVVDNADIGAARDLVDRYAGTQRLLTHAIVHPNSSGGVVNEAELDR